MAYFALTEKGINFIHHVCDGSGTEFISGKNGPMPYTYPVINQIWTANAYCKGNKITNGYQLAEALIYWYNYYAGIYGLDANVLAAQAFLESTYHIWVFAGYAKEAGANQSTASGLNQFISTTAFNIIVANNGHNLGNISPFTSDEIAKITKNFIGNPMIKSSWEVGAYMTGPPPLSFQTGWTNRPIYHQNAIDNPDIMIKAQCVYIKYIADRCNSLTSSTIMCYYQGDSFAKKTYAETVAAVQAGAPGVRGANDGLKYVLKLFGVLGDKDNVLGAQGKIQPRNYKTPGQYFGYDSGMDGINKSKNLRLYEPFDGFNTNLA